MTARVRGTSMSLLLDGEVGGTLEGEVPLPGDLRKLAETLEGPAAKALTDSADLIDRLVLVLTESNMLACDLPFDLWSLFDEVIRKPLSEKYVRPTWTLPFEGKR